MVDASADGRTAGPEVVHLDVTEGIATVTLDSPANRNALSDQLVTELAERLGSALEDPAVRAVHLTATGPVFCAGADLKAGGRAATSAMPAILSTVMSSSKPVVAELNGHVRAGGIGLVAACDIAVAPLGATFAFSEVRLGLIPAMIAVPVTRKMARRALERYFLTGETFAADEAAASGLVTVAVPEERVRPVTDGILDALRLGAPGALTEIKPLLDGVAERGVEDGLRWAGQMSAARFESDEAAEGMAAFRERRPPSWAATGKG